MSRRNPIIRNWYIFKNYILQKKKIPFLASYKITYHCNLKCKQCPFYLIEEENPSYEKVISTLDHLHQRGNRLIVFEGGEPMLWSDNGYSIQDVIREAKKRFYSVGMTTNGTLPLSVDSDVLWVSIDGLEETHNHLRCADIFQRVINNIKNSPHPKLFAHITINSYNYSEIPQLIQYLSDKVKGITIQFYYPYHHRDALFLNFDKRGDLLEQIIKMKKRGYPILNSIKALNALKQNEWECVDWLVDNANPDGSITNGCYLRGRDDLNCEKCGFSPHTEASLAYQGSIQSIFAGLKIFLQ